MQVQEFLAQQAEFENLKSLTLRIEQEAMETIKEKDEYIEQLR